MLSRVRAAALLPLLVLLVAGCGGGEVGPEARVTTARATPRPEISLAVTAVQFEPAPMADAATGSPQLVVVIDNRGRRRVNARVEVRLSGDDPTATLAELTGDAGLVAAGESRVVRLDIPTQVPDRPCYTLSVRVLPEGEATEVAAQSVRTYRVCPGREVGKAP